MTVGFDGRRRDLRDLHLACRGRPGEAKELVGQLVEQPARVARRQPADGNLLRQIAAFDVVHAGNDVERVAVPQDLSEHDRARVPLPRELARLSQTHCLRTLELRVAQQVERVLVIDDVDVTPLGEVTRQHVDAPLPQPVE
jgi:hypothetical protein